jgi:hypothetical protein
MTYHAGREVFLPYGLASAALILIYQVSEDRIKESPFIEAIVADSSSAFPR